MTNHLTILHSKKGEAFAVCKSISANETLVYFDPNFLNETINVDELPRWIKLLVKEKFYNKTKPYAIDEDLIKNNNLNKYIKVPSYKKISTLTLQVEFEREHINPRFYDDEGFFYHLMRFIPISEGKSVDQVYKNLQGRIEYKNDLHVNMIHSDGFAVSDSLDAKKIDGNEYDPIPKDRGSLFDMWLPILINRHSEKLVKLYYKASLEKEGKINIFFSQISNEAESCSNLNNAFFIDHGFGLGDTHFSINSQKVYEEKPRVSIWYSSPFFTFLPNKKPGSIEVIFENGSSQLMQFFPLSSKKDCQKIDKIVEHYANEKLKTLKPFKNNKLKPGFPKPGSNSREKVFQYDNFYLYEVNLVLKLVQKVEKFKIEKIVTHNTRTTAAKYKTQSATVQFINAFESTLQAYFKNGMTQDTQKKIIPKRGSAFSYKIHTIDIYLKDHVLWTCFLPSQFKAYGEHYGTKIPNFSRHLRNVPKCKNLVGLYWEDFDEGNTVKKLEDGLICIKRQYPKDSYIGFQMTEKNKFGRKHVDIYKFSIMQPGSTK